MNYRAILAETTSRIYRSYRNGPFKMQKEIKYHTGTLAFVFDRKIETVPTKIMSVHRSSECTLIASTISPSTFRIEISRDGTSKSAEFDLRTPYDRFVAFVDWEGERFNFRSLPLDGEATGDEMETFRAELDAAIREVIAARALELSSKSADDIRSDDELRDLLTQRINSLEKILELILAGDADHYPTISASIRSLISRGCRNMKPLLQRYAARHATIVPIYSTFLRQDLGGPNVEKTIATLPRARISSSIGPNTPHLMDIDIWLNMPGIFYSGKTISNNDLIRSYADTEGSHVDEKENETVKFLKGVSFGSDAKHSDEMHSLILDVAKTLVAVGRQLIDAPRPWAGLKADRAPKT